MLGRMSYQGKILLFLLVIGLLWGGDSIRRATTDSIGTIEYEGTFKDTDSTATLEEDGEDTQDDSDSSENSELVIQDADTGLTTTTTAIPDGYTTVELEASAVHSGMLLKLDSTHSFSGSVGELVGFEDKNDTYRLKNSSLTVKSEVVSALNSMCSALQASASATTLMVYSTIEVYDVTGSLYTDVLPDRACGYCVDLAILNADETISRMNEALTWISENAWSYGFIYGYTAEEESSTGIADAPYHLRYVGTVHAGIMHQNDWTLTEYYANIKAYTPESPLCYSTATGSYLVYYFEAESTGTTAVPVPEGASYTISGNNTDGFLITVSE